MCSSVEGCRRSRKGILNCAVVWKDAGGPERDIRLCAVVWRDVHRRYREGY